MRAEPVAADEAFVAPESRLPAFLHRFVTPEAVYGLVLYAAIVAAAFSESDEADADASLTWNEASVTIPDSVAVLIWVVLSMLVFWAAHVFAHAVAGHGVHDGKPVSVRGATRRAFRLAAGMLYAPALPTIALVLGSFGLIGDEIAIDAALWTSVIVLGMLGFLAFAAKRSAWWVCILGGVGTAALGLVIIALNAVMH